MHIQGGLDLDWSTTQDFGFARKCGVNHVPTLPSKAQVSRHNFEVDLLQVVRAVSEDGFITKMVTVLSRLTPLSGWGAGRRQKVEGGLGLLHVWPLKVGPLVRGDSSRAFFTLTA